MTNARSPPAGALASTAFAIAAAFAQLGTEIVPGSTEGEATGSEDCLTLNIYAPAGAQGGRLPVMVWIHGGGFTGGSGSSHARTSTAETTGIREATTARATAETYRSFSTSSSYF